MSLSKRSRYVPPHLRKDNKNVIVANPDEEMAAMEAAQRQQSPHYNNAPGSGPGPAPPAMYQNAPPPVHQLDANQLPPQQAPQQYQYQSGPPQAMQAPSSGTSSPYNRPQSTNRNAHGSPAGSAPYSNQRRYNSVNTKGSPKIIDDGLANWRNQRPAEQPELNLDDLNHSEASPNQNIQENSNNAHVQNAPYQSQARRYESRRNTARNYGGYEQPPPPQQQMYDMEDDMDPNELQFAKLAMEEQQQQQQQQHHDEPVMHDNDENNNNNQDINEHGPPPHKFYSHDPAPRSSGPPRGNNNTDNPYQDSPFDPNQVDMNARNGPPGGDYGYDDYYEDEQDDGHGNDFGDYDDQYDAFGGGGGGGGGDDDGDGDMGYPDDEIPEDGQWYDHDDDEEGLLNDDDYHNNNNYRPSKPQYRVKYVRKDAKQTKDAPQAKSSGRPSNASNNSKNNTNKNNGNNGKQQNKRGNNTNDRNTTQNQRKQNNVNQNNRMNNNRGQNRYAPPFNNARGGGSRYNRQYAPSKSNNAAHNNAHNEVDVNNVDGQYQLSKNFQTVNMETASQRSNRRARRNHRERKDNNNTQQRAKSGSNNNSPKKGNTIMDTLNDKNFNNKSPQKNGSNNNNNNNNGRNNKKKGNKATANAVPAATNNTVQLAATKKSKAAPINWAAQLKTKPKPKPKPKPIAPTMAARPKVPPKPANVRAPNQMQAPTKKPVSAAKPASPQKPPVPNNVRSAANEVAQAKRRNNNQRNLPDTEEDQFVGFKPHANVQQAPQRQQPPVMDSSQPFCTDADKVSHVLEVSNMSTEDYQTVSALFREVGIKTNTIFSVQKRWFVVFDRPKHAIHALNTVKHHQFKLRRIDTDPGIVTMLKNNVPPPVRPPTDLSAAKRMINHHLAFNKQMDTAYGGAPHPPVHQATPPQHVQQQHVHHVDPHARQYPQHPQQHVYAQQHAYPPQHYQHHYHQQQAMPQAHAQHQHAQQQQQQQHQQSRGGPMPDHYVVPPRKQNTHWSNNHNVLR